MNTKTQTYYISEIFESIQGEGNFAGVYCLFIRFHFCNLTCHWCDTKYTWWEKSGPFKKLSIDELKETIENTKAHHIIFTGGEPSLYRLDQLFIKNKMFHVETNGTLIPTEKCLIQLQDGTKMEREAMDENIVKQFNWVVSPKLSNSLQTNAISSDEQSKYLTYWAVQNWGIFKFIIKNQADIDEINDIVLKHNIDKSKVYLGIEGQSLQSQLQPELVDEIIKNGYNFSPRLHVMLWGAKRGK